MRDTPVLELNKDICGIPNPKTGDVCVLAPKHEEYIMWHKDGADKEWMGKPTDN